MKAIRATGAIRSLGTETFRFWVQQPAARVGVFVVAATTLAWGASLLAGGSHTGAAQLFYIPIVVTAVRFGYQLATVAAVACGLLAGPLLPADVASHTPETFSGSCARLLVFVAIALLLAWLAAYARPGMLATAYDADLAIQLRAALRTGQLEVYYQPLVTLSTGEPVGVEALVRWRHPRKGLIPPDEFIPAAERTGVIADIDEFVLREAARQLAEWSARGLKDLSVAFNVSACALHERGLVEVLQEVIATSSLDPGRVHLELTETAIVEDVEGAARIIAAVRDLGMKVAIDDFGTGQCSLGYLHQFTVDIVKIDRIFVSTVVHDAKVRPLLAGVIRLFESIGVAVVCEGIENLEQFNVLRSLRGQTGQGYFFAKPAPAEQAWRYLTLLQATATDRRHAELASGES